ncbi:MAG: UvrD-helicase domain-containing protein [Pseudomonadota bacterium]
MDNRAALDPQASVVVEACAGSGKTWLLVSRILRLLLDGVAPGEILAITFTRKAAQEMQERLHGWLYLLASADEATVRGFLRDRALDDAECDRLLPRARQLYQEFLLAQPGITISTFHGWFMQVLQRAPLQSGLAGGIQLVEQTSALQEEAWQAFADSLRDPEQTETAEAFLYLLDEYGLSNTRELLFNFVGKRNEWLAYTAESVEPLAAALHALREGLQVDPDVDPLMQLAAYPHFAAEAAAFANLLQGGTPTQRQLGSQVEAALQCAGEAERFAALAAALYTQKNEPRKLKPSKGQDAAEFDRLMGRVYEAMEAVRRYRTEQQVYRFNAATLRCGTTLLEAYQALKQRQQLLDFSDLEWQICRLLNVSAFAEYMQYKLDRRYRHVLLDEFQDTNPLQWQILKAWFDASAAVESAPKVFVVGDPKQSIYRFRRADARLFGVVRDFLCDAFQAHYLSQNVTHRNAPAILEAVNAVFSGEPLYQDFVAHEARQAGLPGYTACLPLAQAEKTESSEGNPVWRLRNPLLEARAEAEAGARSLEAEQFARYLTEIIGQWHVHDGGVVRPAEWCDVMVLVRKRTHLRVYEQALRALHIPFISSRRGGLLETLEAEDFQALLSFLMTPFADLALAQTLRCPIFDCSDEELLLLAQEAEEGSWWASLLRLADRADTPVRLVRACNLLVGWVQRADRLPVHDLLDRIYFEGDVLNRYAHAVPESMRQSVADNLQAFMEIALGVDAGRYPSLPRFLQQLRELREAADNEAPSEGRSADSGNVLRIYTVHESKGLEAPIVWLLDANDTYERADQYDALIDWPPQENRPCHFSLYGRKDERGIQRQKYFEAENRTAERENLNLLYVAMTRAKQALLVSGSGDFGAESWYGRIALALGNEVRENPLLREADTPLATEAVRVIEADAALRRPLPTGTRRTRPNAAQQRGIWLHGLLQYLVPPAQPAEPEIWVQRLGIPPEELNGLLEQVRHLLALPELQRFFDPAQFCSATNEMPYINARGELHRIDRLVEFADAVWVLDYKMGEREESRPYQAQMREYCNAMRAVFPGKAVQGALIYANGTLEYT